MISKNVTLTINQDNVKLSSKLIAYVEDGAFAWNMKLVNNPYIFDNDDNSFMASVIIMKPDKSFMNIHCDVINKDTVVISVPKSYIDELDESGTFLFQIRLHSDMDKNGRFIDSVSLPPFTAEIKRRIDM